VVWFRSIHDGIDPTSKQINAPFSGLVAKLVKEQSITQDLGQSLLDEARRRNALMHSAMWNLDEFTQQIVDEVMGLARSIDKAGRVLNRKLTGGNI
jgi:hypothetical protein